MEPAKAEENRINYYDFLLRLDASMREAPRTTEVPAEVEPQEATADGPTSA
jgi:hypothetical protein